MSKIQFTKQEARLDEICVQQIKMTRRLKLALQGIVLIDKQSGNTRVNVSDLVVSLCEKAVMSHQKKQAANSSKKLQK